MKWILIWFVTTANGGGGGGSAEFNDYESCEDAIELVELAYDRWDARALAFCAAKGKE